MSWLTKNFLSDVTVFVTTIQPATSREKFRLPGDKNHDRHFSSTWWERRKEIGGHNFENFHRDQSNASLRNSATITKYRQPNFNLIIRNRIQHNPANFLMLKHFLCFELLDLNKNFSPVSE